MGTLAEDYNTRYTDSPLRNRICTAIARRAQVVLGEDADTTNHANRLIWAKRVIAGGTQDEAEKFMWPIIGLSTINGASSDNDLLWAVDQFIDLFATGS